MCTLICLPENHSPSKLSPKPCKTTSASWCIEQLTASLHSSWCCLLIWGLPLPMGHFSPWQCWARFDSGNSHQPAPPLELKGVVQRWHLLFRSDIQGAKRPVLGQEVVEGISHPRHWPQPWASRMQTPPCTGWVAKPAAGGGCKPGSSPPFASSPLRRRSWAWDSGWGVSVLCSCRLDLHSRWAMGNLSYQRLICPVSFLQRKSQLSPDCWWSGQGWLLVGAFGMGTGPGCLRDRAGQAVPACRGAEMSIFLPATQLCCLPWEWTQGSHKNPLLYDGSQCGESPHHTGWGQLAIQGANTPVPALTGALSSEKRRMSRMQKS